MKQTIFTLLVLSTIGLVSCRKNGVELNITQYDQSQIQSYIASNGITGMKPDSVGGDTSGIYYKILTPGIAGTTPLSDTSKVSFVFSLRSFDGKYSNTDTIENHYEGYIGHISEDALPYGLQVAIINDLKYTGGSMRILIPSRLAYGVNGYGTGSIENAGSHIAGNQCLDYYVHVISNQQAYDDEVIQNYIKQQSLTGYIRTPSTNIPGAFYYYKIKIPGTGTEYINQNSTITTAFFGRLLDNISFNDISNGIADTAAVEVPNLSLGTQEAMTHITNGASISVIMPSALGYGELSYPAPTLTIPVNSCLRYEYEIYRIYP